MNLVQEYDYNRALFMIANFETIHPSRDGKFNYNLISQIKHATDLIYIYKNQSQKNCGNCILHNAMVAKHKKAIDEFFTLRDQIAQTKFNRYIYQH